MTIRLLADADLNFAIVTGTRLRDSRIDFLSAAEASLAGISDPEVLTFAAKQGRILVSHDTSTIPVHVNRALKDGIKSPGVFLVSQQTAIREVIDALLLVWSASHAVEWENQITHLPSLARHDFQRWSRKD